MASRRRSKGSGSIRKRGNRWQARFTPPSGTEVTQTFARKADAEDWLALQRTDVNSGAFVEPSDITLGDWLHSWVDTYKAAVSEGTRKNYSDSMRRIIKHVPDLLDVQIQSLTAQHVQSAINLLIPIYSSRSVRMTAGVIKAALRKAQALGLVKLNPAKDIELPPAITKNGGQLIPKTDLDKIIERCKAGPRIKADGTPDKNDLKLQVYRDLILFLIRHGCRPGEARAIRCDKIAAGWIMIDAALDQQQNFKDTKTHKARRIPIAVDCLSMIRRRTETSKNGWLFENSNGAPVQHRQLATCMERITGGRYSAYDLRHTFCSLAVKSGGNIKAIAATTGHSIEMLLTTYVHINDRDLFDVINPDNGQIMDKAEKIKPLKAKNA